LAGSELDGLAVDGDDELLHRSGGSDHTEGGEAKK
jgi:hypothetical protein